MEWCCECGETGCEEVTSIVIPRPAVPKTTPAPQRKQVSHFAFASKKIETDSIFVGEHKSMVDSLECLTESKLVLRNLFPHRRENAGQPMLAGAHASKSPREVDRQRELTPDTLVPGDRSLSGGLRANLLFSFLFLIPTVPFIDGIIQFVVDLFCLWTLILDPIAVFYYWDVSVLVHEWGTRNTLFYSDCSSLPVT